MNDVVAVMSGEISTDDGNRSVNARQEEAKAQRRILVTTQDFILLEEDECLQHLRSFAQLFICE